MEFFTFEWITDPKIWASLITLMALEIVLGIDNLVFISILAGRLPAHQQSKARKVGLAMALITRLMLLATLAWIVTLTKPFVHIGRFDLSWRDVILIGGGLFLALIISLVSAIVAELRADRIVEDWQVQQIALPLLAELTFPPAPHSSTDQSPPE